MRDQPAGDAAGASEQGYKPYSDTGAHIEEAESKVMNVQDSKIAPARESKGAEEAKDQVLRPGDAAHLSSDHQELNQGKISTLQANFEEAAGAPSATSNPADAMEEAIGNVVGAEAAEATGTTTSAMDIAAATTEAALTSISAINNPAGAMEEATGNSESAMEIAAASSELESRA